MDEDDGGQREGRPGAAFSAFVGFWGFGFRQNTVRRASTWCRVRASAESVTVGLTGGPAAPASRPAARRRAAGGGRCGRRAASSAHTGLWSLSVTSTHAPYERACAAHTPQYSPRYFWVD